MVTDLPNDGNNSVIVNNCKTNKNNFIHFEVNVIILVYGVAKYIECCARSLFEQTHARDRIYLC